MKERKIEKKISLKYGRLLKKDNCISKEKREENNK